MINLVYYLVTAAMGSTNEEIIKPHAVLLQSKELYKVT